MGASLDLTRVRAAIGAVTDPEIPVLTLDDLGVIRDLRQGEDGAIEVTITPTYSGCPAMKTMSQDLEVALHEAGFAEVRIKTALAPAWTTDWMSEAGREKLNAYGIAPPAPHAIRRARFGSESKPACPRCGAGASEKLSEFGSTACKSLWRCTACLEPFDAFKCI